MSFTITITITIKPFFAADESGIKLLTGVDDGWSTKPTTLSPPETPYSGTTTTTTMTGKRRRNLDTDSPTEGRTEKKARFTPSSSSSSEEPEIAQSEDWDIDSWLRPTKAQALRAYLGEDAAGLPAGPTEASLVVETPEERARRLLRECCATCDAEAAFEEWCLSWVESKCCQESTMAPNLLASPPSPPGAEHVLTVFVPQ